VYDGEWKDGTFHGKGRMVYANGSIYDGDWIKGKCHGTGKMTYANGNIYVGDWTEGKRHGKGRYDWNSGTAIAPTWSGDSITGKESTKSRKGDYYQGEWKNDKPEGHGEFYYESSGNLFSGLVSNWKLVKGRYAFGANVYDGEFADNAFSGHGKFASGTTGLIYEGEWMSNLRYGHGVLRDKCGNVLYAGQWEDDVMLGEDISIEIDYPDGRKYTGGWRGDAPHGYGKMVYANGDVYEGEWVNGKPHSKGVSSPKVPAPEVWIPEVCHVISKGTELVVLGEPTRIIASQANIANIDISKIKKIDGMFVGLGDTIINNFDNSEHTAMKEEDPPMLSARELLARISPEDIDRAIDKATASMNLFEKYGCEEDVQKTDWGYIIPNACISSFSESVLKFKRMHLRKIDDLAYVSRMSRESIERRLLGGEIDVNSIVEVSNERYLVTEKKVGYMYDPEIGEPHNPDYNTHAVKVLYLRKL